MPMADQGAGGGKGRQPSIPGKRALICAGSCEGGIVLVIGSIATGRRACYYLPSGEVLLNKRTFSRWQREQPCPWAMCKGGALASATQLPQYEKNTYLIEACCCC